jgi:hypothetical protein
MLTLHHKRCGPVPVQPGVHRFDQLKAISSPELFTEGCPQSGQFHERDAVLLLKLQAFAGIPGKVVSL